MKNTFTCNRLTVVAMAAILTACGGGGGGSTTTAPIAITPAPTPAPVVFSANLVTSVPAANYGTDKNGAYLLLNIERSTCGFGILAQNTQLDAAALAHINFLFSNVNFTSYVNGDPHSEIAGNPGFTGADPTAQAAAQGYVGSVGQVLAMGNGIDPGSNAMRYLLAAPYHLRGLMDSYKEVGMGIAPQPAIPGLYQFSADLGTQTTTSKQLLGSGDVQTYPCNGTTGVNYQLRGETPNPIPGRDLAANPIGTPILIKVRDGNSLVITSATMINVSTGAAIALRAPVGAANDPHKYFSSSEAYIAPDAPLQKGTQYQATITGTNNGAAFSRNITFTTGTGLN